LSVFRLMKRLGRGYRCPCSDADRLNGRVEVADAGLLKTCLMETRNHRTQPCFMFLYNRPGLQLNLGLACNYDEPYRTLLHPNDFADAS